MTGRRTLVIAAVTALAGCGGGHGHGHPNTASLPPLDGVYHRSESAAAVAHHDHVPVSQAIAENYGDFVLVIRHGHFALTQSNPKACTWQYGTLRTHGSRVELLFTDGGGKAPNAAENKPGELFVWKATLFRGALTLVPIRPHDLMPETWQHVSDAPTAAALTPACRPPAAALPG